MEFPWVSILPCQAHIVSLLMKDVAQMDDVKKLVTQENVVVTWFSNHHKPLAILRQKSKVQGTTWLCVSVGESRSNTDGYTHAGG